MQIQWYIYPHTALVTEDNVARLPFAPFEWQSNYFYFQSPWWDADLQQYVSGYFANTIIPNRFLIEEALNDSFDMRLAFHGPGQFSIDHPTMRQLAEMNCHMFINHC
jgi:hypothetical protein